MSCRLIRTIPIGVLLVLLLTGVPAAQENAAELYACGDRPRAAAEAVGLTLCDALPTDALSARAGPENLQVREGALVTDLQPGGISSGAGFAAGDLIYRVGGVDVPDARSAVENLGRVGSRADTVVNFLRGGRPYRIKLRRE
ncbi:MAG: hypothetical protein OXQ28_03710 [Acidobacteriota bacterium]|nr:hypothetical protein [Acidobacteriota bacterium]